MSWYYESLSVIGFTAVTTLVVVMCCLAITAAIKEFLDL